MKSAIAYLKSTFHSTWESQSIESVIAESVRQSSEVFLAFTGNAVIYHIDDNFGIRVMHKQGVNRRAKMLRIIVITGIHDVHSLHFIALPFS